MSSGRKKNKGARIYAHSIQDLKDFYVLELSQPPNMPRKARPISKLNFFNKEYEDKQTRTSAHLVNKAKKREPKNNQNNYFFKNNEAGSLISEIEALNCAFAQYLAGDDKVPSATAYYDENNGYRFVGITSKAIPGFKTNHDDPLKKEDTVIEFISEMIEKESRNKQFFNLIENLLKYYQDKNSRNRYWTNLTNFYINPTCTAVKVQEELIQFKNSSNKFNPEYIHTILETLKKRLEHIQKDEQQYKTELELIEEGMHQAEILLEAGINANKPLEEMDKICKLKGLDLKTLDKNEKIKEDLNGEEFAIKVKDIINYRLIKRVTVALVVRFLMQDTDGHNQNMSKDGWVIDWDMAKLRLSFKHRNPSELDCRLRQPNDKTFVITDRDILNFPDIQDADFFYWPTRQYFVQSSLSQGISWFYKIRENFFTLEDNQVFKQLALHPVCIFHKYKTFMKYKLSNKEVFRRIGELHLRKWVTFKDDDGQEKNLLNEILLDETIRMQKVKEVLLSMPAYTRFFSKHGHYVLQLIQEEFKAFEEKYEKKLAHKPYYKNLTNAVRNMRKSLG